MSRYVHSVTKRLTVKAPSVYEVGSKGDFYSSYFMNPWLIKTITKYFQDLFAAIIGTQNKGT